MGESQQPESWRVRTEGLNTHAPQFPVWTSVAYPRSDGSHGSAGGDKEIDSGDDARIPGRAWVTHPCRAARLACCGKWQPRISL